jgi:CPA1 family monovalent cation:H+ antiporter
MDLLTIVTFLVVLAALFGYINVRFLRLPITIGLMLVSIVFSLLMLALGFIEPSIIALEEQLVGAIDFRRLLMDGMLSLLLFAGALHVDFGKLATYRWPILAFATIGVLISTVLVGVMSWFVLGLLGLPIDFIYCLLFGALISPTDPIAALGILQKLGVPKKLEIKIVGESLINDGIGVVVFITLFQVAQLGLGEVEPAEIGLLFLEEVGGGVLLGFALGWLAWYLMRTIDNYEAEVMITLAIVMGGYWLASRLHFSGPLAMVVAGLMIGNQRFRTSTMSEETELYVDKFWEILDLLLNAVLFVLIGLEIVVLPFNGPWFLAGLAMIPVVLLARWLALAPPVALFSRRLEFEPHTHLIMTWGGLRGGISIALALSLTPAMPRDLILSITYVVVVFSIIVQGLTVDGLIRRLRGDAATRPAGA